MERLGIFQWSIIKLGNFLPAPICDFFYVTPFWLFKKWLGNEKGQIWFRNSLFFKDIVFGHSDIDLTYYFNEKFDRSSIQKIERTLGKFKVLFPHLGEIAYYDQQGLHDFLKFANPIELSRDPILLQKIDYNFQKKITNIEKVVFSLNWLKNDLHKMKGHFLSREKKINRFLSLLEIDEANKITKDWRDVLKILKSHLFCDFIKANERIDHFFETFFRINFKDNVGLNQFYLDHPHLRVFLLCCYPQIWIGPALLFNGFEDDLDNLKEQPKIYRKLFDCQIKWEIWGLYGQWMHSGVDINFFIHTENLINCVSRLDNVDESILNGLRKLSEGQRPSEKVDKN
ncbi:MAG: hypothetical protein K9K67_06470 [Bacteriovoracaceae bacterium]|nr:hypothetical protein [Bacteriovoracaceae bacterium]